MLSAAVVNGVLRDNTLNLQSFQFHNFLDNDKMLVLTAEALLNMAFPVKSDLLEYFNSLHIRKDWYFATVFTAWILTDGLEQTV